LFEDDDDLTCQLFELDVVEFFAFVGKDKVLAEGIDDVSGDLAGGGFFLAKMAEGEEEGFFFIRGEKVFYGGEDLAEAFAITAADGIGHAVGGAVFCVEGFVIGTDTEIEHTDAGVELSFYILRLGEGITFIYGAALLAAGGSQDGHAGIVGAGQGDVFQAVGCLCRVEGFFHPAGGVVIDEPAEIEFVVGACVGKDKSLFIDVTDGDGGLRGEVGGKLCFCDGTFVLFFGGVV